MPAGKELRWRGREDVLISLIERVRVADDLEPVPNAEVPRRRGRAVSVLVRPGSAAGRPIEEDVGSVFVTRRDADERRGPGESQVHRRRLQNRAMEIQIDPIRRDGLGKRVDPASTGCNYAGRETRERVVYGMNLKRVESRGLGRAHGDRGIPSTKQGPPDRRRHETVGPIEVVAGSYDNAGSGRGIRPPDAARRIESAPNHIALQVQYDLAVRCEVDREDSVSRTGRADNGARHLHSKHGALVGRLEIRVERHDGQAPAGSRQIGIDDLAFLDTRGDEVAGRSRHNGDRVAWPDDVFDRETSYRRTIAESQEVIYETRRGPYERFSGRLEPGRQPRFVKAHDPLSEEGRAIRYGERLAQVVHPGPNENARSCIGR